MHSGNSSPRHGSHSASDECGLKIADSGSAAKVPTAAQFRTGQNTNCTKTHICLQFDSSRFSHSLSIDSQIQFLTDVELKTTKAGS